MFETIKSLFRKSEVSTLAQPQPWLREALGSRETNAGVYVTPIESLNVSAVCACVRLLSESVASLPLFVYRRTETSKIKAPEYPTYWVLHDSPNDYQTSYTWRAQIMTHVLLHGNSYSFIERDSAGIVKRLWPLLPELVTVRTDSGEIRYDYYSTTGQHQDFAYSDILHIKGPSLNGITGMSIIGMARQGIGLAMAVDAFGARYFKNDAKPQVVLEMPNIRLTPEQKRDIINSWVKHRQDSVGIVEAGMKIQVLSIPPEDSQFLETRQFSVQEIARWFRVSPTMIGDLSRSTYSNSEQEALSFLVHSLRPWLVNLESEINLKCFPSRTQFFSEFGIDALQRADTQTRYESYSKGLAAGFLTPNEVRRIENLPDVPGGDELLRPVNMAPANAAITSGGNNNG